MEKSKTENVFSSKLKILMKEKKTTQQELANEINVTRQAVAQYMEGKAQPVIEKLFKIAKFFNVSADWLLGLSIVRSFNISNCINYINDLQCENETLKATINKIKELVKKGE